MPYGGITYATVRARYLNACRIYIGYSHGKDPFFSLYNKEYMDSINNLAKAIRIYLFNNIIMEIRKTRAEKPTDSYSSHLA